MTGTVTLHSLPATHGIRRYEVLLDGRRIGTVSRRPGRSFSGGWSGWHETGHSVGHWHRTRAEAVQAVVRADDDVIR